MTRHRLDRRFEYALEADSVEVGASRLVGWFFPLADFREPLVARVTERSETWRGVRGWRAEPYTKGVSRIPFAWGFPPPWDSPLGFGAHEREVSRRASVLLFRADLYVKAARRVEPGLADLAKCRAVLEARGCRLVLAQMPRQPRLDELAARQDAASMGRYRDQLASYLAASGLPWVEAPQAWPDEAYFDLDHLAPAGGRHLAAWVSQRIGGRRWHRPWKVVRSPMTTGINEVWKPGRRLNGIY